MKFSVQVIVHPDDDREGPAVVREVFALDRDALTSDTLGLRLAESQDLLAAVQDTIVAHQVQGAVAAQTACPECGRPRRHKDTRTIVVRSLFGALRLPSPRWWHCDCREQPARTFQPLAELLPERTTPELAYLQARFAGLVSYGITAELLGELLPLGRRLHPAVVRRQTQAVAQRLEDELGDERFSFIGTCQRDREELPRPDLPLVVGLGGGYVHSASQRSRRDGWFEVIAGWPTAAGSWGSSSGTARPDVLPCPPGLRQRPAPRYRWISFRCSSWGRAEPGARGVLAWRFPGAPPGRGLFEFSLAG